MKIKLFLSCLGVAAALGLSSQAIAQTKVSSDTSGVSHSKAVAKHHHKKAKAKREERRADRKHDRQDRRHDRHQDHRDDRNRPAAYMHHNNQ